MKRIQVNALVAEILMPRNGASVVNVAVCQDGRGKDVSFDVNLQRHLQAMYVYWGYVVEVRVHRFSFVDDDVSGMMKVLREADIFYMAGVFAVSELWIEMTNRDGRSHCLVEKLQERVQYHTLAVICVCGGAMISGASNKWGLTPLDLLQGTNIKYHANCNAASVSEVSTTENFILTTGCGVAINIWQDTRQAISLVVVKNHAQWHSFAGNNSVALMNALVQKVASPRAYLNPVSNERWWFYLDGRVYRDGRFDQTTPASII